MNASIRCAVSKSTSHLMACKLILAVLLIFPQVASAEIEPTGRDILTAVHDIEDREALLTEERLRKEHRREVRESLVRSVRYDVAREEPEMIVDSQPPQQFVCSKIADVHLCRFVALTRSASLRGGQATVEDALRSAYQALDQAPFSTQRRTIVLEQSTDGWRVPEQYVLPMPDTSVEFKLKDRDCIRIRAITGDPRDTVYVHETTCGLHDAELLFGEPAVAENSDDYYYPFAIECSTWQEGYNAEGQVGRLPLPSRIRELAGADAVEGFSLFEECVGL